MKLWAKVRFRVEKNAEYLIRAFFQNFNSESSIVIRGTEAKLEVIFDKSPIEIIEAISYCEVLELNYGNNLTEYKEENKQQVEPIKQICKETSVKQPEPTDKKSQEVVKFEQKAEKNEETETKGIANIPELDEIAERASSFENFVKLTAEWLEMDKRQEFFEKLVILSTEIDKISWKELEEILKDRKVFYTKWDKIWSGRQISEKLKSYSITMIPLLSIIGKYKEYHFKNENTDISVEEKNSTLTQEDVKEQKSNDFQDTHSKVRIKMECMPEMEDFEEVLGSVDKTQPIGERVRYVLVAMGLNRKSPKEQHLIFEITNTAVRKGKIAFDIIFVEAKISMEDAMTARTVFSKFLNDYVAQHKIERKIKVLDFLSQLQKIIIFEDEIQDFSDLND